MALRDFVNYSAKTDPRLSGPDLINYPVNRKTELGIFLDSCIKRCKPKEAENDVEKSEEEKEKEAREIKFSESIVNLLENPIDKKDLLGGYKKVPFQYLFLNFGHLNNF